MEEEALFLASALMHAALHPRRHAVLHARPSERWALAATAVYACGASITYAAPDTPVERLRELTRDRPPHVALFEDASSVPLWEGVPHLIILGPPSPPALGWEDAMRLGRVRLSHYDKDIAERSKRIASLGSVVRDDTIVAIDPVDVVLPEILQRIARLLEVNA